MQIVLTISTRFKFRGSLATELFDSVTLLHRKVVRNRGHLKNKLISPFDALQVKMLHAALYGLKQLSSGSLKSSKSIKQALSC